MTDMTADIAAKLRAPFQPDNVGKLPRVWCGKCRDAIKNRRPSCDDHQRAKCNVCSNNMTTAHLHLDYVGHAAITDRLLQVDPLWVWEPVAFGPDGLPMLDRNNGLWIRLTVAGVTRLGYGDAEGKTGPAAVKEAIGDALRNGAMRFGVGLDLWHKDGQLHQDEPTPTAATDRPRNGSRNADQHADAAARDQRPDPAEAPPAEPPAVSARKRLAGVIAENNWDRDVVAARFQAQFDQAIGEATDAHRINAFTKNLYAVSDVELRAPAAANGTAQ